jgi:hypothetical protein
MGFLSAESLQPLALLLQLDEMQTKAELAREVLHAVASCIFFVFSTCHTL